MEIFTQEGGAFLSRYGHVIVGVTWIGLLYYFNFVQVPAFAKFDAEPRGEAVRKLVPRALWWFRWSALLTVLTGLSILAFQEQYSVDYLFRTAPGISISTGILLALVMFANVWLVIWPNQKVVIANAVAAAEGKDPDPNAVAAGRKALLASRTNTMLSIPMLYFMVATSHFSFSFFEAGGSGGRWVYWLIVIVLVALFELVALGVLGTDTDGVRAHLDDHRYTIVAGFVFAAVLYLMWEILLT